MNGSGKSAFMTGFVNVCPDGEMAPVVELAVAEVGEAPEVVDAAVAAVAGETDAEPVFVPPGAVLALWPPPHAAMPSDSVSASAACAALAAPSRAPGTSP